MRNDYSYRGLDNCQTVGFSFLVVWTWRLIKYIILKTVFYASADSNSMYLYVSSSEYERITFLTSKRGLKTFVCRHVFIWIGHGLKNIQILISPGRVLKGGINKLRYLRIWCVPTFYVYKILYNYYFMGRTRFTCAHHPPNYSPQKRFSAFSTYNWHPISILFICRWETAHFLVSSPEPPTWLYLGVV